jgi:hypothetical protein
MLTTNSHVNKLNINTMFFKHETSLVKGIPISARKKFSEDCRCRPLAIEENVLHQSKTNSKIH